MLHRWIVALVVLAAWPLATQAQTTAQGQTLYGRPSPPNFDCARSGCHAGASKNSCVNKICNGTSWSTLYNATQAGDPGMVSTLIGLGGVSETQAQALSCYIQSWFGAPTDPWCGGTPSPPACTVSSSNPTPTVGSNITLTASCANNPASYTWTNCMSSSSTCNTTSSTAGSRTYSVTATNAGGTSAPAWVNVNWQAAPPPPSCSLSASNSSPTAGSAITLTASCTNNPTSYAWTNCASSTSSCGASSPSAGTVTYSVTAGNAGGSSSPASVTVNWQPASGGAGLTMPSPVGFGAQPIGVTSAPLSAQIGNGGATPVTISALSLDNSSEFAIASNGCATTLAPGASCSISFTFTPAATGTRSGNVTVTSNGAGSPQSFLVFGAGEATASSTSRQGLYWNASESGWGLNVAHQGNVIFATWFTYAPSGRAWWVSMTLAQTSPNVFAGDVIETHGPAFSSVAFNPSAVSRSGVGTATLDFNPAEGPRFSYSVNGVTQTKALVQQVFSTLPSCSFPATKDLALATNYQDLWWAGATESGWGINLTHQGEVIFATWFTYDADGSPLWLSISAAKQSPGVYAGELVRTAGPAFSALPFNPAAVTRTVVGSGTFTFATGSSGTFAYTVDGISQTKSIVRQVLVAPGTLCQ